MSAWALARNLSKLGNFDVTHLLVPKLNPFSMKLGVKGKTLLKHIFIYPFHSGFAAEKLLYSTFGKNPFSKIFGVNFGFSAEILKTLYNLENAEIIPPAINTRFFRPKTLPQKDKQLKLSSALKLDPTSQVVKKDNVLLYMGPLLPERFNFKTIIGSFIRLRREFNLDVGLLIVGRELGNSSRSYMENMLESINKNNLSDSVFVCLKNLTETEKICVLNASDVLLYPFHTRPSSYSVVFPPIVLLESMSAGLSVVSGGLPYLETLVKDNENGVMVNDTSETPLTEGIVKAITNKKKISKNARLTIEKDFSIQRVSRLYLDFLSRIGI